MSNYIEQAAEFTEADQAIRAHLRQACERKMVPEKLASYPALSAAFKRGFDSVEQASSL